MPSFDPIGYAVSEYYHKKINDPVTIHSDEFEPDLMYPAYLFRNFQEMPMLEQKALKKAYGKVLDVGACAGCHSVYLQEKGLQVTALEQSIQCCEILEARQIKSVVHDDFFHFNTEKFDTILLLMNGTGIAGTLSNFPRFLQHLKSLLAPKGQILIDSSDLIYLYLEEDGSAVVDINAQEYYGELRFQTEYKGIKSQVFPWLYLDPTTLEDELTKAGLKLQQLDRGEHYDYLATIKRVEE